MGSAILFCVALGLATKNQANTISILGASWLAIGGSAVAYLVIREWRSAEEPIRQSRMLYLAGFFLSALMFTLIEGLAQIQSTSGLYYDIRTQGPLPPISALLSSLLSFVFGSTSSLTRLVGLDEFFTRLVSLFIPALILGGVMTVSLVGSHKPWPHPISGRTDVWSFFGLLPPHAGTHQRDCQWDIPIEKVSSSPWH